MNKTVGDRDEVLAKLRKLKLNDAQLSLWQRPVRRLPLANLVNIAQGHLVALFKTARPPTTLRISLTFHGITSTLYSKKS